MVDRQEVETLLDYVEMRLESNRVELPPAVDDETLAALCRAWLAQAAPSTNVGVEGLPEEWRREAPRARVDVGEDAALAWREAVYWCAFQLEAALAQRPAPALPYVDDDDLTVAYMAGRHDGRKEAAKAQELEKKLKQAHKDFGCELMDPCGTIWEYAEKLKERVDKAEREAEEWKAKAQELEEKLKWAEWVISLSSTEEGKHGKEG